MLMQIKDMASGWLAYLIVGLISVPFALWGINQYFYLETDPVVISVAGEEIPYSVFQKVYQERKRAVELDGALQNVSDELVQRDAISFLVRERIWRLEADRYGYVVTDLELAKYIENLPEFAENGVFDREKYKRITALRRESQASFEASLRNDLLNNLMPRQIVATSFVLNNERKLYEALLSQQRQLRYVVIPAGQFIVPESVDMERATAYYEENSEWYEQPEAVRLEYIEFDEQELVVPDDVSAEEVDNYYQDNKDEFFVPEQLKVAHILFDVKKGGELEAWERAESVYKDLEEGEGFAELASAYSDDSLTADKGGELPLLSYGDVNDKRIVKVLESLSPGYFSAATETEYGVQIFKLLERDAPRDLSVAEASDDIRLLLAERQSQEKFNDLLADARNLAYENVSSLEVPARELNLEIKQTPWLSRSSNTGIMQYPEVKEAAFADDVVNKGYNSEVLEVEPGHAVVVRVKSHRPVRQKSFAEVKVAIISELLLAGGYEAAGKKASSMVASLRAGAKLVKEAQNIGFAVKDLGLVRRDGGEKDVERLVINAAFRMQKPSADKPRFRAFGDLQSASYYIVELDKINEGAPSAAAREASETLSHSARELEAILLVLLGGSEIDIALDDL